MAGMEELEVHSKVRDSWHIHEQTSHTYVQC